MRLSLQNIQAVIIATAVLQNICRNDNIGDVAPEIQLAEESDMTETSENSENIQNDIRHREDFFF